MTGSPYQVLYVICSAKESYSPAGSGGGGGGGGGIPPGGAATAGEVGGSGVD